MPGSSSGVKNYDAELTAFSDDDSRKAVRFCRQSQNKVA
jgi:hypothetical protein